MGMTKIKNTFISDVQPQVQDGLWLKVVDGGVSLYLIEGGCLKPLKVVDDKGTETPDDDTQKQIITVTNIKNLTPKQCNALNVGDQVIKKTGKEKHLYVVSYKNEKDGEMCLNYNSYQNAEEVYYDKTGGDWAWIVTHITPLTE